MSKLVRGILVLLVLFVAPVGSWYYLKSGFQYQKQVRDELESFGQIKADLFQNTRDSSIFLLGYKEQAKILDKVTHQFGPTEHFQVMLLNNGDSIEVGEVSLRSQPKSKEIKDAIKEIASKRKNSDLNKDLPIDAINFEEPEYLTLLDTNFVVRGIYDTKSEKHIKRMIEHIAILLPYKYKRRGE